MTEAQITAVRGILGAARIGAELRHRTWQGQYAEDVALLLGELDTLANVIHDLQEDSLAHRRGREEALAEFARVVSEVRHWIAPRFATSTDADARTHYAAVVVAGGVILNEVLRHVDLMTNKNDPQQLPPSQIRQENERLRLVIRDALEHADDIGGTAEHKLERVREILEREAM